MFKGGKDFDTEIKLDNLQLAKVLAFSARRKTVWIYINLLPMGRQKDQNE